MIPPTSKAMLVLCSVSFAEWGTYMEDEFAMAFKRRVLQSFYD